MIRNCIRRRDKVIFWKCTLRFVLMWNWEWSMKKNLQVAEKRVYITWCPLRWTQDTSIMNLFVCHFRVCCLVEWLHNVIKDCIGSVECHLVVLFAFCTQQKSISILFKPTHSQAFFLFLYYFFTIPIEIMITPCLNFIEIIQSKTHRASLL